MIKTQDLEELFKKHDEEFLEFDRVENKLSKRRDVHLFVFLDNLMKESESKCDLISDCEHSKLYFILDIEEFCHFATEQDIIEAVRCGLMYSVEFNCLYKYA